MSVTALPRPLAPWAALLALFPRETALALAPLVQRLHVLLGEGRGAPSATGEPDGYDGIARRGTYERLVATEWLLLSEMPDEFLRRVAAGEHSFLELARRPPAGGRHAAVLFDTGPDQLGAPRLAHVAALVVLAARLSRQKGTLSWGVLQDETSTLEQDVSRPRVQALLAARSRRPVARRDVERWLGSKGAAGLSELWLCGAEDLRPPDERRRASMLIATEVLEPGARRLHVAALAAGSARAGQAVLDMPPERACVQILRDPFATAPSPRVTVSAPLDPAAGLVFSENGRRLYVRSEKGQLLIFVVPNSPRSPVPPHAVFEPPRGQVVVAAGIERSKSRTVVVCAGKDAYFSHRMSVSRRVAFESREHRLEEGAPPPSREPGPLMPLRVSEAGVLRFTLSPGRDVLLRGDVACLAGSIEPPADAGALLQEKMASVTVPAGTFLVGRLDPGSSERDRRAVLVDRDRRRLEILDKGKRRRLVSTAAPIDGVQVERDLGLIGFLTEGGEVGVYSLRQEALVLQAAPGSDRP